MGCCSKPQEDMVWTAFEITLISATDLEGRKFGRTRVYAKVSIGRGAEQQSPVDRDNGTNPVLHFNTKYPIDDSSVRDDCTMLVIKLYCQRRIFMDRYIGEVHVSLKKLKDEAPSGSHTGDYPVTKGSKDSQGTLRFSYKFEGTKASDEKPSLSWIKRPIDAIITFFGISSCISSCVV